MARWAEYCHATKGRHVITGHQALEAIYPAPEPEVTDEEAVAEEQDGTLVAMLDGAMWRAAVRQNRRPMIAQALTALETGGITAMIAALQRLDPKRRVVARRTAGGVPLIEYDDSTGRR